MVFKTREKKRLPPLRSKLFSPDACKNGRYNGIKRDFCLVDEYSSENLHESIRDSAIGYFRQRGIDWHKGLPGHGKVHLPSNHLCCSQSACVNTWFPYTKSPVLLGNVLQDLGFSVAEVLPINCDMPLQDGDLTFVSFEWIGLHNYLRELRSKKIANCWSRTRGSLFTSADFAFRFLREDSRIQIILGEWKYTEYYTKGKCIRYKNKSQTDRLAIYLPELKKRDCPIRIRKPYNHEHLFYDPFDQLMRLQLLAKTMERNHEMGADIVTTMHIAPRANTELMERITSPAFEKLGKNIHQVWQNLMRDPESYKGIYIENLIPIITKNAPNQDWADWMNLRYGGMQ